MNLKQITAEAFGDVSFTRIDVGFYQDLAACAAKIDLDLRDETELTRMRIKSNWRDLLFALDAMYSANKK